MPCVIYCHGNCGCRVDALDAVQLLLPKGITVFCFDFSGSGLSDGDYVSLGFYEVQDVLSIVSHLQQTKGVSKIALWGRSMGAATSLMFTGRSTDNSISGIVADSGFCSLEEIIRDLIHNFRSWIPNAVVKIATDSIRKSIATKALFDISENHPAKYVAKLKCPVLFAHAEGDNFIKKKHSEELYKNYGGEKTIIFFPGDHNTSRPEFFFDQVGKFFERVLLHSDVKKDDKKEQQTVKKPEVILVKTVSVWDGKLEDISVDEDDSKMNGKSYVNLNDSQVNFDVKALGDMPRNESFTIKRSEHIQHDIMSTEEQAQLNLALINSLTESLKTCENEEEKKKLSQKIEELKQNKDTDKDISV